jgi:O-antigen ligase
LISHKIEGWKSIFIPSLVSIVVILTIVELCAGMVLGMLNPIYIVACVGAALLAIVLLLRQYELAAVSVIAASLCIDWYMGTHIGSLLLAALLLCSLYLTRSERHPWVEPGAIWLWFLFLTLTIYPTIRGTLEAYDFYLYYAGDIVGAFLMFWLGTVIAHNGTSVWRLFQILSVFGTLIAIHTVIQGLTGKFLFGTSHFDVFLAEKSDYQILGGAGISRVGSFFVDPNWNGTFMAMMLIIVLGLFFISHRIFGKLLYLAEVLIILCALLFTYSGGSWGSALAALGVLLVFAGRNLYRVLIPLFIGAAIVIVVVGFPVQFSLLIQHTSNPDEIRLRSGAWQTAWRVIQAYPLTGVGLGQTTYGLLSQPYRVPDQYVALAHPHNSYLEIGAMAGLPVLFIFLALLLFGLWQALRNWIRADVTYRTLLGCGIASVIALTVNSWSINGWTLPPIAAVGWLILGAISSPSLAKSLDRTIGQEKKI